MIRNRQPDRSARQHVPPPTSGEDVVELDPGERPGERLVGGQASVAGDRAGLRTEHVQVAHQRQWPVDLGQLVPQLPQLSPAPTRHVRQVRVHHHPRSRRGVQVGDDGHPRLLADHDALADAGKRQREPGPDPRQPQDVPAGHRVAGEQRDAEARPLRRAGRRRNPQPTRRAEQARLIPIRHRAHRFGRHRCQVDPSRAILCPVDFLQAEHVRVELGNGPGQPRRVEHAVGGRASVQDVVRRQPHQALRPALDGAPGSLRGAERTRRDARTREGTQLTAAISRSRVARAPRSCRDARASR